MRMRILRRRWGQQAILLAALALFLRILIPAGWMPASDRIGLTPCFGTEPAVQMHTLGHHEPLHSQGHEQGDRADRPCAFAGFACALAEPRFLAGVPLPAIAAVALLSVLPTATSIGTGLAAPPPPPTGPPSAT